MVTKRWSIGLILVGAALLFSSVTSAGEDYIFPGWEADQSYPAFSELVAFRSSFADPPSFGCAPNLSAAPSVFDAGALRIQRPDGYPFGDPEPEETFYGVVAIDTDKGKTVICTDRFGAESPDMNFMDIDVSKIIVIAINTGRGGTAIATSDILVQPTQGVTGS